MMCLIAKNKRFKKLIAKKDIKVYKSISIKKSEVGTDVIGFASWYYYKYKKGLNSPKQDTVKIEEAKDFVGKKIITSGVFHCYKNKKIICNIRAYIPKGTEYYIGLYDQIATRCLEIREDWRIEDESN